MDPAARDAFSVDPGLPARLSTGASKRGGVGYRSRSTILGSLKQMYVRAVSFFLELHLGNKAERGRVDAVAFPFRQGAVFE